jgi:hypothetical protein
MSHPQIRTSQRAAVAKARELYFNSNLNQSQIAALVGVSQRTISHYISENKWAQLKQRAEQMPAIFLDQMNNELQEINEAIASRPPGKRFPTPKEAETRRKIMYTMAGIKERQAVASHIEVLLNFISYIQRESVEDARRVLRYTDEYLVGEMKFAPAEKFSSYNLPTTFSTANPTTLLER